MVLRGNYCLITTKQLFSIAQSFVTIYYLYHHSHIFPFPFHGHFNCHKNFQYHCCDLILSPSPLSLLFPPSHLVSTTLSLLMPLVTWLSFVFVITYIFKYLKFNCHSHCHPISTDNILCNLITNIITIAIAVFTPSNSKVVVITNLNFITIIPFQFLSSLPKILYCYLHRPIPNLFLLSSTPTVPELFA